MLIFTHDIVLKYEKKGKRERKREGKKGEEEGRNPETRMKIILISGVVV